MTEGVELAAPTPNPEPKPSSFSRITGIFFAPGETLASIVRRPDILVPLAIVLAVSLLAGILIAQKVDFKALATEAIESSPRASRMPPDMLQKQIRWTAGLMKAGAYGAPIFGALMLIILAAILFAAFKIFGGDGEFKQALSITTYAWYPTLIKSLLSVVALMSRHSMTMFTLRNPVASNIGYFISPKLHPIAFAFFSTIDVFTIWTIILLIIGFSLMSGFSRMKSAVIVISLWCVLILFAVAGGALQAMQMRMK